MTVEALRKERIFYTPETDCPRSIFYWQISATT